jgi:DNA-binding transcriptional ArsR family regulator
MPDAFTILADPTRRRIVEALRAGECSVNELVGKVGIGQPGVSRQLAIMQDADFVVVRPEGRRRLYALRPEPFWEMEEFMKGFRGVWEARLDRFGVELESKRRNRKKDQDKKERT